MRIMANKDIRRVLFTLTGTGVCALAAGTLCAGRFCRALVPWLWAIGLPALTAVLAVCIRYFRKQSALLEEAVLRIHAYLDGDTEARIDCDEEGELYQLFHAVNSLAAVLNAHASKELREKEFLKNTISDISHQLKTPLAALYIYNGLLQEEASKQPQIREFVSLSEQELDRIGTLVQNLLKITRLDAGAVVLEKSRERVADMMQDISLHFAYRARQEEKTLLLSGEDAVSLFCDRDWLTEAVDNLVKNALDHTKKGDTVRITWKEFPSAVQIMVEDNGCGIHPEDLHYIFKRFYRSRFSEDRQGIGLGLPLAKAIIEAHDGMISVDSEPGRGTVFLINFPIPSKL